MSRTVGKPCNHDASEHGKCYWGVLLASGVEVLFYADRLTFGEDGGLVARSERKRESDPEVVFAVGAGRWVLAYSADRVTGKPVSVLRYGSARHDSPWGIGPWPNGPVPG